MDNQHKITATVCLYSGRPNPHWEMDAKEYDKLLLIVKKLPVVSPMQPPSLLGYTGLLVTDGLRSLYIFNEVVTITEGKSVQGYKDADRKTEKEVLQSAPASLLDEIKAILPEKLL